MGPRLNHGGTDTTDGDGLTTLATTGTERGLPTPSQLLRPMPKPSFGGTEAMGEDGLTTLAITGTERGPPILSQPLRLMPRLNPGGMDIMDGVGHMAITGVNKYWSGWMMSKTLTEAFIKGL